MPLEVVVDSYVPCEFNVPVFTKNHEHELWVVLLEKAWAKIHGSYQRISFGLAHETMRDLTGAPGYQYTIEDEEEIFKIITDRVDQKHAVTISCGKTNLQKQVAKDLGLVISHSYSVFQAKEIDGVQLLQIRNPWGNFEWQGVWGDKSSKWTPKMKKDLNLKVKDDGLFWMDFTDVKKYFGRV